MQCYMNGGHRKAESDRNKRRDLDYKQEIGSEVESFHDPGNNASGVTVDRVMGLHPSSSAKNKFQESRNCHDPFPTLSPI